MRKHGAMPTYTRSLEDLRLEDVSLVGGKTASLGVPRVRANGDCRRAEKSGHFGRAWTSVFVPAANSISAFVAVTARTVPTPKDG